MATVSFRLNRPKDASGKLKSAPVSILVSYYNTGIAVGDIATGQKVRPADWDGTRVAKDAPRARVINKLLSDIENALLNIPINFPAISKAAEEKIARAIIKREPIIETSQEKKTVIGWITSFTEEAKVSPNTKKNYRAALTHLKGHANKNGVLLTWDLFDLNWYDSFITYLYDAGHNDNTVGRYIKTVKKFLNEAFDRGEHQNLIFKKRSFRAPSAEVEEVYLSEEEINKIETTPVPARLQRAKELLIFACWVGLRYSDLRRLTQNNLITGLSGPMFRVITKKTQEVVSIPAHPAALEIWQSWNGQVPNISNPDFNIHVKDIAELAGITQPVERRNTIEGRAIVEWVPKYKMVTAHTTRRSFATNCYLKGIPIQTIMAVTGHRTEQAFKKYLRITKDEHAKIMAGYFSNQTLMRKTV